MSEEKQLAEWLDHPTFPSGLPAELEEASLVFRPDLAPAPRIDIDKLWTEAQATALESQPEEAELVSDIFAQQSIAAPRVSIEDIFNELSSGPLAASEPKPEIDQSSRDDVDVPDNVIPLRPWFKSPMLLGGLAAAMALIILLPTRYQAPDMAAEAPPALDEDTPTKTIESTASPKEARLQDAQQALRELEELAEPEPEVLAPRSSAPKRKAAEAKPAGAPPAESAPVPSSPPASAPTSAVPPPALPPPMAPSPLDLDVDDMMVSGGAVSETRSDASLDFAEAPMEPAVEDEMMPQAAAEGDGGSGRRRARRAAEQATAEEDLSESEAYDEVSNLEFLRAQANCPLQNPYGQPLDSNIEAALAATGAERVELVRGIMSSASANELIYLSILIFSDIDESSASNQLESALRVNGASESYRCAGYAWLGNYFYNQGDRVKAEAYYRQAVQP